jgi:hypothetical protein
MADLTFRIEWEPTEGVSHPVLAATWARIEIRLGDRCVTTVHDTRTGATRSGVYGPAALIAEWIVRNFWFVLFEGPPAEVRGHAWRRRHSLAAAREGTSLPDLMLFRDERNVVAEWVASSGDDGLPVRFVEAGRAELEPAQARLALATAVDAVVDRLRTVEHPDAAALRSDWDTIAEMSGSDLALCSRAARLGLDALDAEELTENLESCLVGAMSDLPETTRNDVLDAQIRAPEALASTIATVRDLVLPAAQPALSAGTRDIGVSVQWAMPAYRVGYAAARRIREQAGLPTRAVDLTALFQSLGLEGLHQDHQPLAEHVHQLQALVGASPSGAPRMFVAPRPHRHSRFLLARGLFAIAAGAAKDAPRALTNAGTRLQAASRAFAAELLAPASLLRSRIADGVDDERVEALADELDVSPAVIAHQITNHGLSGQG